MTRYAPKVAGCPQWECAGKSYMSGTCLLQRALEMGLAWGVAKRRLLWLPLLLLLLVVGVLL